MLLSGIVLLDMNISRAMGPYMDLGLSPQWVSMLKHIVRLPLTPAVELGLSSSNGGRTGGIRLFGASNKNAGREGSTLITEETDIVYQVLGNEVINYCTAHFQQMMISILNAVPPKYRHSSCHGPSPLETSYCRGASSSTIHREVSASTIAGVTHIYSIREDAAASICVT